ncbi:tektin-5-like [Pungitius pungitius]|uniref:tektin-5-like n=1 Tax=Pungitius pungitius TaxID=134920 RepID=UPI0018897CF9|nr:tektin-5-like [Pungitius pungitius]
MWQRALKEDQSMRPEVRLSLPALTTCKTLLSFRPQMRSNRLLKLGDEVACSLGGDIAPVPSSALFTMRHLGSRHKEVSQWQAQIFESIGQVDLELTAVEQSKDTAERCLQEKQLFGQLIGGCVAIGYGLCSAVQGQSRVLDELKREEQLNNEIKELLQKQICVLLIKSSSLKEIRTRLLADFQDKSEAIKLTTKCINHRLQTSSSELPGGQHKPNYVSYDHWLSHCKALKGKADHLMKDSSIYRQNLRFTLVNEKNAQERQRRSVDDALRQKINELSQLQNALVWERQRLRDEMTDQTRCVQNAVGQIRSCDSKLQQATQRLDILDQRPRQELCLDQAFFTLRLEEHDLANMAAGLLSVLKHAQQELECTQKTMITVQDHIDRNARTMGEAQKCQKLHQSFLPALDPAVVFANKHAVRPGRSSAYSYLQ